MSATMRPDALVYISGPLTPKNNRSLEANVAAAVTAYLQLIAAGIPAFCPHLSAIAPGAFDIDYEAWMAYDLAVLDRCTHVLTLDGWKDSAGALREVARAHEKGIPVCSAAEVFSGVL